MIFRLLDYLYCKPATGFTASITGWILGSVNLNAAAITYTQETLLWYFQIISLLIGSIAGFLTIISLLRRKKKEKNSRDKMTNDNE